MQYVEFHAFAGACFTSSGSDNFIYGRTKCVHGVRIMLRIFVLPSESILALCLFPQNLEHCAIINEIKAFIHSLYRDALALNAQLVEERIRFSAHQNKTVSIGYTRFHLLFHFGL